MRRKEGRKEERKKEREKGREKGRKAKSNFFGGLFLSIESEPALKVNHSLQELG